MLRFGRVHAGQPDGVGRPGRPYADGVAVDDALDQGGAGLRRRWRDGQQRGEDGQEEEMSPAIRPHTVACSSRFTSH